MKKVLSLLAILATVVVAQLGALEEKPMVIVVPSYKNEQWYRQNLDSIFCQDYENYHVIYIDDCSPDHTADLVEQYIAQRGLQDRITLIKNQERHGALYNLYHAIHGCSDESIIVTVDGDDCLAHAGVLAKLNEVYANDNVWLTYGQFVEYPTATLGFCQIIPDGVIKNNLYRSYQAPVSHLRTFYAWLFKKIDKEDLMYEGDFFAMTWDKAMMWPMLEMSGGRFKFIPNVLYIYNNANPISDHKVDRDFQMSLHKHIQHMKPYQKLSARN